jgi:hypothetical protein
MKGVKMKLNMDIVNCVLLVVILALVIYCVVKQNENFSYIPEWGQNLEEDTGDFKVANLPTGGAGRQNANNPNNPQNMAGVIDNPPPQPN